MVRSVASHFTSSLAVLVQTPIDAKYYIWLFELFTLCMEFRLVLSAEMAKLLSPIARKPLTSTLLYSLVEQLDIQRIVTSINNPTTVWTILIALLTCLVLICWRIVSPLEKEESHASVAEKKFSIKLSAATTTDFSPRSILWTVTSAAVYLYGYVFYIVGYFTSTIFMCKSVPVLSILSTTSTGGITIMSSTAMVFDANNVITYTTKWSLDATKECLGGDYFVMGSFGLAAICLSLVLLMTHSLLTGLYPDSRIYDCKRNNTSLIPSMMFWVTLVLRNILEVNRASHLLTAYFGFVIGSQALSLGILLLGRPFHNKTLVKLKVFKCASVVLYAGYVILGQEKLVDADSLTESWLNSSKLLWVGLLMLTPILAKMIDILVNARYTFHVAHDSEALVYFFENLRYQISRKSEEKILKIDTETYSQITQLLEWGRIHRLKCTLVGCECKKLDFWSALIGQSSLNNSNQRTISKLQKQILYLTCKILFEKMAQAINKSESHTQHVKQSFILWSNFSMRNLAPENKTITILAKILKSAYESNKGGLSSESGLAPVSPKGGKLELSHRSTSRSVDIGKVNERLEPSLIKDRDFDRIPYQIRILAEMVTWKLKFLDGDRRQVGVMETWSDSKVESENPTTKPISLEQIMGFFTDSLQCEALVLALFANKADMLALFEAQGDTHHLLLLSQRQQALHTQLSRTFAKLHIPATTNDYKTTLLRAFYLTHLREDVFAGRKFVAALKNFRLTSNLTALLETGSRLSAKANGVVLGVSAETESLHKIVHSTMNVASLGYSYRKLVGEDLRVVLPQSVGALHKSLLSSTSAALKPLMMRPTLDLFVLDVHRHLVAAKIDYRLNPVLGRGLEFVGLLLCEETAERADKAVECHVMTSVKGEVLDVCETGERVVGWGGELGKTNSKLAKFFQDFAGCKGISDFQQIWEGRIKVAKLYNGMRQIQAKKVSLNTSLAKPTPSKSSGLASMRTHHRTTFSSINGSHAAKIIELQAKDPKKLGLVPESQTATLQQISNEELPYPSNMATGMSMTRSIMDDGAGMDGLEFVDWTDVILEFERETVSEVQAKVKITPTMCFGADQVLLKISMIVSDIDGNPANKDSFARYGKSMFDDQGGWENNPHTLMIEKLDKQENQPNGYNFESPMDQGPSEERGPPFHGRDARSSRREIALPPPAPVETERKDSQRSVQQKVTNSPQLSDFPQQAEGSQQVDTSRRRMEPLEFKEAKMKKHLKPGMENQGSVLKKGSTLLIKETSYNRLKSHTYSGDIPEDNDLVVLEHNRQLQEPTKPEQPRLGSDEKLDVIIAPPRKREAVNIDQASTAHATHTDDFAVAKYSRFLHENVQANYSKVAAWTVCLPLICMYLYLLGSYYFETWAIDRFSGVTTEVNSFDCEAYYFWVIYIHGNYINIKRMALEGLLYQPVMERYGFDPALTRITEVMAIPSFQDKLWQTDGRQTMNTYKSNYSDWYDQTALSSTFLPFLFYNNDTQEFETKVVNARDGTRYITRLLNPILSSDLMDRYILGPSRDKKLSPYEHVVRWNLMNPSLHYYRKRKLSVTK